ncbi:aldo/keto reductase [Sinorhizobium mexicanum]|uniref:Aldo/keto reductase n=1 Tax=Sinorhizobium mexicanum TaxID=375549 RepID=A0A859QQ58_9HYPH|nr:aldo/keto reductase [Sinorhizobium mexicanum]MBP1881841.1 2,5-diketo-D-gluconate reductase A [Sinorhizobium mexicanum]QLL61589.1 aldo/keto reductase [Sinorhizobium mexicanum]
MQEVPVHTLRDGRSIPALGFGVWQIEPDATERAVAAAISSGYRSFDTAEAYFNEEKVGNALRRSGLRREEYFLTTKVWNTNHGYSTTLAAFDASMRRLGVEQLDLYLLHWPSRVRGLYVETWQALIRLQQEGRVRSIGVSNFSVPQLSRLISETGIIPAVNQVELHPRFQQRELRSFHQRFQIATQSWSPLGMWKNGRPSILNPTIQAIAREHGKTPAQVVLRWHLQEGLIPLTRSVNGKHIAENFDVFDFELSQEDMRSMRSLDDPAGRLGPNPDTAEF